MNSSYFSVGLGGDRSAPWISALPEPTAAERMCSSSVRLKATDRLAMEAEGQPRLKHLSAVLPSLLAIFSGEQPDTREGKEGESIARGQGSRCHVG